MAASFWKPGTARPGSFLDRATEAEDFLDTSASGQAIGRQSSFQAQRSRLPITPHRDAILYALEQYPVVVVIGHTGSGKTTQIPQYLLEAGWASQGRQIAVSQPRRISAVSVAARVAAEVGSILGDEVGYTIQLEDFSHPERTRLRFLTNGSLFMECMRDPLLSKYSVIMVDEAHERSAYSDLLVALLKKIRRKRPELRIIISSATLDAQAMVDYFEDDTEQERSQVTTLSLEGRSFPVEVAYLHKPCSDYVQACIDTVWSVHLTETAGDILVFVTGREEIDRCLQSLSDRMLGMAEGSLPLQLLPLHAGISAEEQADIFTPAPRGTRKCIVATNVAETSVTIDGIRYVVDSGLAKMRLFNARSGMDVLQAKPISQASATQRAGRAGRTSPGKCYRLWTSSHQKQLPAATLPELARIDITPYVLKLKALGIDNLAKFDYLPPAPPSGMMVSALEYLSALGALDDWGRFTPMGEKMAEIPTSPMLAKVLLASEEYRCTAEALSIAAMMSVSSPFVIPDEGRSKAGAQGELERRKFTAEEGDALTLLNVFAAFVNPRVGKQSARWCGSHCLNFKALSRAVAIRSQLHRYMARLGVNPAVSCEGDTTRLLKCLTSGFFRHAARRDTRGEWRSVRENALLHVHPSSVLFNRNLRSEWLLYSELVQTTKSFMRDVTVIERDWLTELAPHFYQLSEAQRPLR
ncbi:unnamed protein product [Parajaminaea phylloscopi]